MIRRLTLIAALAGCHTSEIIVGGLQEISTLKAIPNPNLDLLFVVDSSPSMLDSQASLAANFPRMIDVLEQLDGDLPSLHIAVVTPDLGTLGSGSPTPAPPIGSPGNGGCAGTGDDGVLHVGAAALAGRYISDLAQADGSRLRNYTGELRDVFSQIANVGGGGCGFEQHLAAMRRALTNPANTGFIRPDANLAVVIIGDEDDCSVLDPYLFSPATAELGALQSFRCTRFGVICSPDDMENPGAKQNCAPRDGSVLIEDVQHFVDALVAVKGDPRTVMVAGIVGNPAPVAVDLASPPGGGVPIPRLSPSCVYNGQVGPETADPAVRLAAFLDAFPGRSQLTSICDSDLSAPLGQIGSTAKKLIGDPCLDSMLLADTSSDPGLQPACEVIDVRDSAPDAPVTLPTCDAGGGDCFEIQRDATACPTAPENLRVRFHRSAPVAADTWTHVRCQLGS
jgi:hypothetical protein